MERGLEQRIGTTRVLHLGERVALGLAVAAGEIGRPIEAILVRHGLDSREYAVLRMLRGARRQGLRHGEIAERMLLGSPDVTRIADKLKRRGWIRKQRDEIDGRVVLHHITPAGVEKLEELEDPLSEVFDRIVASIGPATAEDIVRGCERAIVAGAAMETEGSSR